MQRRPALSHHRTLCTSSDQKVKQISDQLNTLGATQRSALKAPQAAAPTWAAVQDLRSSSLARSLRRFVRNESAILSKVIVPLLSTLRGLHAAAIGHHHISPFHVFLLQRSRSEKLALDPPSPLAAPEDINEILADDWPDEYFPPDMWSLVGSGHPLHIAMPLTSDLWALGVLMCYLYLGSTLLEPALYVDFASDGTAKPSALKPRQRGSKRRRRSSMATYRSNSSVLSRVYGAASQAFSTIMPTQRRTMESLLGADSMISAPAASADPARSAPPCPLVPVAASTPEPAARAPRVGFPGQAHLGDIASLQLQNQKKEDPPELDTETQKLVSEAKAVAELSGSLTEVLEHQVQLLASAGASQGVRNT